MIVFLLIFQFCKEKRTFFELLILPRPKKNFVIYDKSVIFVQVRSGKLFFVPV